MQIADIKQAISIIKDPFNERCMTDFDIYCSNDDSPFSRGWRYRGRITFKNGNTEGSQRFDGDSLRALLLKMQKFVTEELHNKA